MAAALEGAADPAGFFVARVRGEEAVRDAPHLMAEDACDVAERAPEGTAPRSAYDERLGELPSGYGDDALVALPRDPRSLFVYWDHAPGTLRRAFDGLDRPRAQLWVFARAGAGWERVRVLEIALEARAYYVHDLDPGRTYRAELHAVGSGGAERLLGTSSGELPLPPAGRSPVVDDRFLRLPWDQPLAGLLGPGHWLPDFSDEDRDALARLSDWSRAGATVGGSAGGMGGRPSSPGHAAPSSPSGGGGGER